MKDQKKGVYLKKFKEGEIIFIRESSVLPDSSLADHLDKLVKDSGCKHVFIDLTNAGLPSSEYRRKLMKTFKEADFEKTAIVADKVFQVASGGIMKLAGVKNFKFFDSEEEACDWLLDR